MITRARKAATLTTTLLACPCSPPAAAATTRGDARGPGGQRLSTSSTRLAGARDLLPAGPRVKGTITAAVSTAYAPHSFFKEGTTEFVGYEIEIFDDVAEILGLDVEYAEAPFQQLVAASPPAGPTSRSATSATTTAPGGG